MTEARETGDFRPVDDVPITTAAQVKEALASRWPSDQFVSIEEAPQSSDRSGRKIDMLVISCWSSRGYALDAVEVKVSVADWRAELKNPEKADWWWQHANRFWLAAPAKVAAKIKPELPEAWGLLSVADSGRVTALVHAPTHKPKPLPWPAVVGVLRAARGTGIFEVQRARQQGYMDGLEHGRSEGGGVSKEDRLKLSEYDRLKAQVTEFEQASGLSISAGYHGNRRLGEMVALVDNAMRQNPTAMAVGIRSNLRILQSFIDSGERLASTIETLGTPPSPAVRTLA